MIIKQEDHTKIYIRIEKPKSNDRLARSCTKNMAGQSKQSLLFPFNKSTFTLKTIAIRQSQWINFSGTHFTQSFGCTKSMPFPYLFLISSLNHPLITINPTI